MLIDQFSRKLTFPSFNFTMNRWNFTLNSSDANDSIHYSIKFIFRWTSWNSNNSLKHAPYFKYWANPINEDSILGWQSIYLANVCLSIFCSSMHLFLLFLRYDIYRRSQVLWIKKRAFASNWKDRMKDKTASIVWFMLSSSSVFLFFQRDHLFMVFVFICLRLFFSILPFFSLHLSRFDLLTQLRFNCHFSLKYSQFVQTWHPFKMLLLPRCFYYFDEKYSIFPFFQLECTNTNFSQLYSLVEVQAIVSFSHLL